MSTTVKGDKEAVGKSGAKPGAETRITRPQTGSEYLDSLRDDRTVYIYGERVKDVTTHPAFRNTARMVARLLRRPARPQARQTRCMVPTDTGNGGKTHAFFKAPKTLGGSAGRARRHRRMGADHLRLARPLTRLQGVVPGDARRQRRVLRSVSGERATLVQIQPGARAVRQSRHHPSAGRSRSAAERGRPTSAATSRRKPTPASSSPAPRSWPPDRC